MKYLLIGLCAFSTFLSAAPGWAKGPSAEGPSYMMLRRMDTFPYSQPAQHVPKGANTVSPATNALERASYPKEYFRNPLDIPIKLAANFGELRANHYHMGLDIRTQQKENLPVMAAADGYVARVVIEPLGFGQAIYIRHPNGYTTLYAHLNKFYPALAAYVDAEQYKLQSWQVSLDIPAGLFPVKKGMFIALSGNRGGSQGPHLHFEIRRTQDDTNLNPLLFGMPVADDVPPVILRLGIYDRSLSTYEQSPRILPVRRSAGMPGECRLDDSLVIVGATHISFSISAFDSQSGSTNPNGIYQATLYEDDTPISSFVMDNISYSDTRKINAHIDYKTRERGGPWLQHLSRLPGYTGPTIYQGVSTVLRPGAATGLASAPDGVLNLTDGLLHHVHIEVKDAYGNATALNFQVQYRPSPASVVQAVPLAGKSFSPGSLDGFEGENVAFYVGENSLYDNVHIGCTIADSAVDGLSPVYEIGSTVIPLQDPLLVRIRPRVSPGGTDRVVMVRTAGGKKDVVAPEWLDGWASARFREFGGFQLVEDRVAPVITPVGVPRLHNGEVLTKAKRIAFRVKDDLGAIRLFRAELDGQWLCFSNDKYLDFIYDFDKHCGRGKHVLKVMAEDVAGNKTTREYTFTR